MSRVVRQPTCLSLGTIHPAARLLPEGAAGAYNSLPWTGALGSGCDAHVEQRPLVAGTKGGIAQTAYPVWGVAPRPGLFETDLPDLHDAGLEHKDDPLGVQPLVESELEFGLCTTATGSPLPDAHDAAGV